jgi:aminoglycoside 6'-N-acetyltransferase
LGAWGLIREAFVVTLILRPFRRGDLSLLSTWLTTPHVARWWRTPTDDAALETEFGGMADGDDPTEGFVVELDGAPIGFMQRYRLSSYPAWGEALAHIVSGPTVGLDYLIGPAHLVGRGLGPRMIEALVDATWGTYPEVQTVAVDVLQDNRASWRALEKAHFERAWAGELRSDDLSDVGPCYVYLRRRAP